MMRFPGTKLRGRAEAQTRKSQFQSFIENMVFHYYITEGINLPGHYTVKSARPYCYLRRPTSFLIMCDTLY